MADYSDLDPTALRASLSDGTNLKKSITTALYTSGTPSAANQVKPSIMYADGTLKESITYADGTLKPSWLIHGGAAPVDTTSFITTWASTAGTITVPTTGTGYTGTVTWTDSLGATVSTGAFTDGDKSELTATVDGVNSPYTCTISGTFPRIYFNNGGDKTKIRTVEQWGSVGATSFLVAFYGVSTLTINATDAPVLTTVTSLNNMFRNCNVSGSMNHWDVSNITDFSNMFHTTSYNESLSSWDVSSGLLFVSMFQSNSAFNQNLSTWVPSSATSLKQMFYLATAYNQPLFTSTANVASMRSMFHTATSFDQDFGVMDFSSVTDCVSFLLNVTVSTANYDASLVGIEAQTEPTGITFHGGSSKHSGAGTTARGVLTGTSTWTITDGGAA